MYLNGNSTLHHLHRPCCWPAITKRYEFDDLVEAFRFGFTYRVGHVAIRMPGL